MPKAWVCGCRGARLDVEERAFMAEADPFGLILFRRNIVDRAQVLALTSEFRDLVGRADAPVLIDQEGGRVQRLAPPHWRAYPAAQRFLAELPREKAIEAARLVARLIAHDLREVGIDVDCAPVLDVADDLTHAVIGSRAYAFDPDDVAALGQAAMQGLLDGGVLPIIKHIPGHGRARADSHHELPTVAATLEELQKRDFAPFRTLRDAPAAMTAHVVYAALDPSAPATQSKIIVEDVIRGEIGFNGLLFSDDMSMKALNGSFFERTVKTFAAGVDIVLHCNGDLTEARAVAEASPRLAGVSADRAARALSCIAKEAAPFDVEEACRRLGELWQRALG